MAVGRGGVGLCLCMADRIHILALLAQGWVRWGGKGEIGRNLSEVGVGSFCSWAPCSGLSDSGHVKQVPSLGCPVRKL